jgi:succinate dehydrogenase / fumarate reductase cytochrome b subunit
MWMFSRFRSTLSGYVTYSARGGLFPFLLHRITGLGTLLFLTIHITTTASVYFSPSFYNRFLTIFRTPLFMLGEIILVFCVIFHGCNGLRIAYFDLFKPDLWKKPSFYKTTRATLLIALVLWLPAAAVMGYNLLKVGLGLFGEE